METNIASPPLRLSGTLSLVGKISGSISVQAGLAGTLTVPVRMASDYYDGEYTIRPSTEAQVLPTQEMMMRDNITIEAIPRNYGLITWNGSTLTVS